MTWVTLDETLRARGLTLTPLAALTPNRHTYRVMLQQHKGAVLADHHGVHNENMPLACRKFATLFQLADRDRPDIMATPGKHWGSIGVSP